jgi:hypothetical protein
VRDRYARLSVLVIVILALFGLADCSPESSPNSLGDAYVAPASLNLRSNLAFKSTTVAVLKHGQHLSVIDVKRRFVQVRTDKGAVGWLDSRQLLSKEQMDQFRKETARGLLLASQGKATTFDILNVHIDPDRRSPAFAQIPAAGIVEVLAHKAVPRPTGPAPVERPSFLKPPAKVVKRRHSKSSKSTSLLPPMPPPPAPPENWQELSKGPEDEAARKAKEEAAKKAAEEAAKQKPVILEDWSLIRTKDKVVGWVLARNLYMSIPDEVAQYAEGQRISSYFDLGAVEDEEKGTKHDWLWTTSSKPQPFDFDRFRVFYWNRRRHRYETSYRQRDLVGYFPVKVERAPDAGNRAFFTVILQDDNGGFVQKRYSFDGTLVHLVSTEPYTPPSGDTPTKAAPLEPEKMKPSQTKSSWFQRQYQKLKQRLRRRTGN